MVSVRSVKVLTSTEAGRPAWIWGSNSLIESTTAITLAPGWRWTLISTAGFLPAPARQFGVLRSLQHIGDVAQKDRRAVLIRHHDVFVGVGVLQLVVGIDGVGLHLAVEAAFGRIGIVVGDGGAQVVDIQAQRRHFLQIDLHPHGRPLAAGNAHQPDAGQLRNLLGDTVVGQVLDHGDGQGGGADRQSDHRRIGGMTLA